MVVSQTEASRVTTRMATIDVVDIGFGSLMSLK
jgi:hypothetical protein